MTLSAPLYQLKRKAKLLAKAEALPLHAALDRIAVQEGFPAWSLLALRATKAATDMPSARLFSRLSPGDMLLIGARPSQGKTLMSLKLAVEAMKAGHRCHFFTLEYTKADVLERFRAIGAGLRPFEELFDFDGSDGISADHIIGKLANAAPGTLVVVDYLQLLDQRRDTPPLSAQVGALAAFAKTSGVIFAFISQIDRSYDSAAKPCPDLSDIRLPNPVDLSLFSKAWFLNKGQVRFQANLSA
ncbi:DNA helicase [Lacibacterium aquatile]|uniref:DNA helicase n=1 Tax=Lacibacterium aquatile TaxID=1168082 RepID=A0ABW5DUU7_9PROT